MVPSLQIQRFRPGSEYRDSGVEWLGPRYSKVDGPIPRTEYPPVGQLLSSG
jgi:hypothetical protein